MDRRSNVWVVLPAAVVLALVAYAWGRRSATSSGGSAVVSTPETGERLAALEREVQGLRAVTRRLSATQREAAGAPPATVAVSQSASVARDGHERSEEALADDDGHEPLDPAAEERQARETENAFWAELQARVDAEVVDAAWRRETEPVITKVISAQLSPEVRVDQVFCASSLCRVTLSHPSWPVIPSDRLGRFALNRESLGSMEMQLDGRKAGESTLYFLRQAPTD